MCCNQELKSISVVVPAHNASKTLETTINSILNQTRKVDEIIIVENGSSDSTPEVARMLSEKHESVVHLQSDTGVSIARNHGIAAATSECIGFSDADDTFRPDAIETLAYFLGRYDVDFVKGNLIQKFAAYTNIWRPNLRVYNAPLSLENAPAYTDFVGTVCGLYRRDFLLQINAPFPVDVRTAEDRVFVWKTLLHGARFVHVDKVVYEYDRTSETSILGKVDGPHFDLFKAYEIISKEENLRNIPAIEFKFWHQYVSMMQFTYQAEGRLTDEGKRKWLHCSKMALSSISKSEILKKIYAMSNEDRRAFLAMVC